MPRGDYSEGAVAAGPGPAAPAPWCRSAVAFAGIATLPFRSGAGGGAESFLPGTVGCGLDVILGRLAGQLGPAIRLALDPLVFFAQAFIGASPCVLLGFATETLDQLLDPLGRLAANLLGAFHHATVNVGLDLGDPLAGQRLEFIRMRFGLGGPLLGLAGPLVGGLDPVLGFALGGLAGFLGQPLGHLLKVPGAGREAFLALGSNLCHRLVAGFALLLERAFDALQVGFDPGLGFALVGILLLKLLGLLLRLEPCLARGFDLLAGLGAQLSQGFAGLGLDLFPGLGDVTGGLGLDRFDPLVGGRGGRPVPFGFRLGLAGFGQGVAGGGESLEFGFTGSDLGLACL